MTAPVYIPPNSQSHRQTSSRSQQQDTESLDLEPSGGAYQPNASRAGNNSTDINWQELRDVVQTTQQSRHNPQIYGGSGFTGLPRQANRTPQSQGYSTVAHRGSADGSSGRS